MFHTQRPSNFFKFSSSFLYKPIFNKKPSVLITILISRKKSFQCQLFVLFCENKFHFMTKFSVWKIYLNCHIHVFQRVNFFQNVNNMQHLVVYNLFPRSLKLVMTILCKVCHRFIVSFRLQEILELVESNH